MPNRTKLMTKLDLEPETSLSHVWVTASITPVASMTGIKSPQTNPPHSSRVIFLKYITSHPALKSFRHFQLSTRQRPNVLMCHLRHSGLAPIWLSASSVSFLLGLQWTSVSSRLGQPPPVLQTHHILKDFTQLWSLLQEGRSNTPLLYSHGIQPCLLEP